jgi:predicted small metal-binding protein
MGKVELECPACGMKFTGDTKEEAQRKKKEHAEKHHSD